MTDATEMTTGSPKGKWTLGGSASGCLLFLIPPLGIILAWLLTSWKTKTKVIVTVVGLLWFAAILTTPRDRDKKVSDTAPASTAEQVETSVPPEPETKKSKTDPLAALKAAIEGELGKGNRGLPRITSIRTAGPNLLVNFAIDDNLTEGMIKTGAQIDVTKILKVVELSGQTYTEVVIFGSMALVDKFGNSEESNVLKMTYSRGTLKRINWENFTYRNVYAIADDAWLHPAMR